MEGLIKYNFAQPDATGVATDNIDEMISFNQAETARRQEERFGTIQARPELPYQDEILDMVTGSYGGAIGKIGKAAITGGQLSRAGKTGKDFYHRLLKDMSPKEFVGRASWDEELSTARKLMEKALNKYGISPTKTLSDPVSEILHALKFRKN